MTTFPVPEDQALADALTLLIKPLGADREAVRAVFELRSAAAPKNGFTVASVPHGPVRDRIAVALRVLAADGHPLAEELRGMAAGLSPETATPVAAEPAHEPVTAPVPALPLPPPSP